MIDGLTHAIARPDGPGRWRAEVWVDQDVVWVASVAFATRDQALQAATATLRTALSGLLSAHEVTSGALPA